MHLVYASHSVCEGKFRHLRIRGDVEITGLNYVTRRGAIYVWRRRLPVWVSQTSYLQISLQTPKFSTAKILANLVNAGFATCISRMKSQRISDATKLSDLSKIQDLAAEVMQRYALEIERRHKKNERLKSGANYSDTLHRTVIPLRTSPRECPTTNLPPAAKMRLRKNP